MTETNGTTAYATQLTEEMGAEALQADVSTTVGAPISPCILCIEPENDSRREYVLFDGTFTGTRFITTALGNRYLEGSAAGSGITHPVGSLVTQVFTQQHWDELKNRISEAEATIAAGLDGAAEDPHGDEAHTKTYAEDPHDEGSHDSTVARILAGTYVGDGTNDRVIPLPFTPTFVYIAASASSSVQWWVDEHQMVHRAHDGQGSKFTPTVVENGFKVSGPINQELSNANTVPYEFVAFGNSA